MVRSDLTNRRFGNLVAIKYEYTTNGRAYWECVCDCGKITYVAANHLLSGHTKSCGCFKNRRKPNNYDLSGRYAKIIFEDGTESIFNKKYYNAIKQYHWFLYDGHVFGTVNRRTRALAVVIMEEAEDIEIGRGFVVDHINRDSLDNRRSNLRICGYSENGANSGIQKNNTSGVTGVYYDKKYDRWMAKIGFEGKLIHLGFFYDKNDAIRARKRAERKYFGRFAPR